MAGSLRERKNALFGLGPFLACELDEKNGIIITTISVIKLGFCSHLHGTLTCDEHSAVLGPVEKLLP